MRRSRSSIVYILLVVFVCFAAGVASVLLRDDGGNPVRPVGTDTPGAPGSESAAPTLSARKITVVLFGVDDLSNGNPRLQAVWFASFAPPSKSIRMLGVPIDTRFNGSDQTIEQAFALFEPPDYGAELLTSLASIAPHPIHGFAVLDEEGFAALIDYIGGVTLDGQSLDGGAAVGALSLLEDQPLASLRMQSRLVTSLVAGAAQLGRTPELTPLTALVPEHAYTSPSPYQLASLGSQLLPIDPGNVTVDIEIP